MVRRPHTPPMSGAEMKALAIELFGEHRWMTGMARALIPQLSPSTVWRWSRKERLPDTDARKVRLVARRIRGPVTRENAA